MNLPSNERTTLEALTQRAALGASVRGVEASDTSSSVQALRIENLSKVNESPGRTVYEIYGSAKVEMAVGSGFCVEEFDIVGTIEILGDPMTYIVCELRLPATEPSCYVISHLQKESG